MCRLMVVAALVLCLGQTAAKAGPPEIRGVWAARDSLGSRDQIRTMMRNLAEANFNLVYVLVWSQGYTLWPSDVFERETGIRIDPQYAGRDILQEAIEEGRQVGLSVVPWVEYGFVGGWSARRVGPENQGPIFAAHPDWVARKKDGDFRYFLADGTYFTWMNHFHPEVQRFLLDLMAELAARYDVPAVQFDRARLPALDCGYDEFTKQLYASEHDGRLPPQNEAEASWIQWRSAKINQFVARLHRTLKDQDWRLLVTNAPGLWTFAYVNFAQDYPSWMRAGSLDFVTPQVYRRDLESYVAELDRQIRATPDPSRLVPGVDITNSNDPEVLIQMIEATRERGLPGAVIWYYQGLVRARAFDRLKQTVFSEKAKLPFRSSLP
ncbi:MAG: family 10 glycosylhydrolase [Bryobacteraceae bacterium]|nr:family 10 glycosylhydrolase [Bryobacteraceae bacterium]MDW8379477.1 family 10 glycosylhydrolase [Bryobacterales bacterium]